MKKNDPSPTQPHPNPLQRKQKENIHYRLYSLDIKRKCFCTLFHFVLHVYHCADVSVILQKVHLKLPFAHEHNTKDAHYLTCYKH